MILSSSPIKLIFVILASLVVLQLIDLHRYALQQQQQQQHSLDETLLLDAPRNPSSTLQSTSTSTSTSTLKADDNPNDSEMEKDQNCPFRNTKLYRSVYVYQHPDLGPPSMKANPTQGPYEEWPWIPIQNASKEGEWGHYAMGSQMDQYTLEIILHELFTHEQSCLQTDNPDTATLFYMPFFNSVHFHNGKLFAQDYSTTPYAQAMMDAMEHNYKTWEEVFGITSHYWKRHNGADHISIMTEPLHGFWHPRNKRGNYHYIHSQYQLKNHIVISVEVSTAFVRQYPNCAKKNIVVPYPNPDGWFYNGHYEMETLDLMTREFGMEFGSSSLSPELSPEEMEKRYALQLERFQQQHASPHPAESTAIDTTFHTTTTTTTIPPPRPYTMFYSGGNHGTCSAMRKSLAKDFACSSSGKAQSILASQHWNQHKRVPFPIAMRLSSFCPCPGGDSPSAKRMYDAVLAGCIPVILSQDFVWALSTEYDDEENDEDDEVPPVIMNPNDFSIRLDANDFIDSYTDASCHPLPSPPSPSPPTTTSTTTQQHHHQPLHDYLEQTISSHQLLQLRQNLARAKHLYSFYAPSEDLPRNTLKAGILPTGGAAHALIHALGERAGGVRWPACELELQRLGKDVEEPRHFVC